MRITHNTIFFKSGDDFYFKEKSGIKPNTVRTFNDMDELKQMIEFQKETEEEVKYIEIRNRLSPHLWFKRQIRDISVIPREWIWIISWFHEVAGIQDGYNAPLLKGGKI